MFLRGDSFHFKPTESFASCPGVVRWCFICLRLIPLHFLTFVLWCRMLYDTYNVFVICLGSSVAGLLSQSRYLCILHACTYNHFLTTLFETCSGFYFAIDFQCLGLYDFEVVMYLFVTCACPVCFMTLIYSYIQ